MHLEKINYKNKLEKKRCIQTPNATFKWQFANLTYVDPALSPEIIVVLKLASNICNQ